MKNQMCAVLNADYNLINFIPWERAMALVHKGGVEVVKYSEKVVRTFGTIFKVPSVVRLMKLVRLVYKASVPFNKKAVFVRDNGKCQYCGKFCNHPTIDHVIPQSKGGKSSWENCVTACKACNAKKADKSCREANMFPAKKPIQPTIHEYIMRKLKQHGAEDLLKDIFN